MKFYMRTKIENKRRQETYERFLASAAV